MDDRGIGVSFPLQNAEASSGDHSVPCPWDAGLSFLGFRAAGRDADRSPHLMLLTMIGGLSPPSLHLRGVVPN
jgi:hypothetical protein